MSGSSARETFSAGQVAKFKVAFDHLDSTDTLSPAGRVSRSRLFKAIHEELLGEFAVSERRAQKLDEAFVTVDSDKSGDLHFADFLQFMHLMQQYNEQRRREELEEAKAADHHETESDASTLRSRGRARAGTWVEEADDVESVAAASRSSAGAAAGQTTDSSSKPQQVELSEEDEALYKEKRGGARASRFFTYCVCPSVFIFILMAVLVGTMESGLFSTWMEQLGVLDRIDAYTSEEGWTLKGNLPVLHRGKKWGFYMNQLHLGVLKDRTYIVTGANKGLGYWTAYHLASRGGHVVMACRDMKRCEVAANDMRARLARWRDTGRRSEPVLGPLECMELNLASFASVLSFARTFRETHSQLHSVILNAAVVSDSPDLSYTADGIEMHIGVNHFGHALLVRELQGVLERSWEHKSPVTVVAVSSVSLWDSYPEGVRCTLPELNDPSNYSPYKAYSQSKLANVLWAQELAQRYAAEGKLVLVNSLHPGAVMTAMPAKFLKNILPEFVYRHTNHHVISAMQGLLWHPRDAALTVVYAAVHGLGGRFYVPIAREARPFGEGRRGHAGDVALQQRFWEFTERVLDDKTARYRPQRTQQDEQEEEEEVAAATAAAAD